LRGKQVYQESLVKKTTRLEMTIVDLRTQIAKFELELQRFNKTYSKVSQTQHETEAKLKECQRELYSFKEYHRETKIKKLRDSAAKLKKIRTELTAGTLFQVKATLSNLSDHPYDLCFSEGQIINVVWVDEDDPVYEGEFIDANWVLQSGFFPKLCVEGYDPVTSDEASEHELAETGKIEIDFVGLSEG
jgi:hypothetical protein